MPGYITVGGHHVGRDIGMGHMDDLNHGMSTAELPTGQKINMLGRENGTWHPGAQGIG